MAFIVCDACFCAPIDSTTSIHVAGKIKNLRPRFCVSVCICCCFSRWRSVWQMVENGENRMQMAMAIHSMHINGIVKTKITHAKLCWWYTLWVCNVHIEQGVNELYLVLQLCRCCCFRSNATEWAQWHIVHLAVWMDRLNLYKMRTRHSKSICLHVMHFFLLAISLTLTLAFYPFHSPSLFCIHLHNIFLLLV